METRIIALQGNKGSGKDTASLYIKYLLDTPRILHNYSIAKLLGFNTIKNNWSITSYASSLKKMLAVMLNIDINYFEDRRFKEEMYFDFNEWSFYNLRDLYKNEFLTDKDFSRHLKKGNLEIILTYKLSVRQILQCFGTDVMRRFFGDKLWINNTLNSNNGNIIISDQRFLIENESIREYDGNYVIHITRPGCEAGNHPSEKELIKLLQKKEYDVLINNDGSLEDLFNTCKEIVYNLK